ncbi:hypothetical protein [Nocardia veterana]|uniref:hypothetical protein n=1 Tax=Nocardia veterana TaxID=132249 RepID=UPI001FE00BEC|nr:hypothetical protein [Nocardia veterana]
MSSPDTGHAELPGTHGLADGGWRPITWNERPCARALGRRPTARAVDANLVVMLVACVALLTGACAGNSDRGAAPTVTSTTVRQLEAAPAPDPATPDGVAVAALREIFTWYPATESQGASLSRARKWLGPSLLRTLDTPPGEPTPRITLRWAEWGRAGVRVEAFTFASGEQAPGTGDSDHQQFKIGIEQTAVHPDGTREPLPPTTVIATVVRTPDGWRLDGFR